MASLFFRNKIYYVKKYIKDYYNCSVNRSDNRLSIKNLQLIQTLLQPIYTISLDFVTILPTVSSKDIL